MKMHLRLLGDAIETPYPLFPDRIQRLCNVQGTEQ